MSEEKTVKQLQLDNDKYRFFTIADGSLYCERYGKPWRDFVGDHAVTLLFEAAVGRATAPDPVPVAAPVPIAAPVPGADPLAARQVAEWLFDYESLLNSLANQFRVTRDEDLESTGRRLEERAKEVSAAAGRLYDQKGVLRDSEYTDLLLREAEIRLRSSRELRTEVFHTNDELRESILRHLK